eukprot:28720-Eustigmatos_ZCMA.PRE.1
MNHTYSSNGGGGSRRHDVVVGMVIVLVVRVALMTLFGCTYGRYPAVVRLACASRVLGVCC